MTVVEVDACIKYAPAAGGDPAVPTVSHDIDRSGRPIRVLVVDDDPRVRAALRRTIALEAGMVMVAAAADSASALRLAGRHNPSVAVVDVLLPEASVGLALVRHLSQRPGCAVVVI
ncbi:MAG: response regulator, partial [Antricoccus sp.]